MTTRKGPDLHVTGQTEAGKLLIGGAFKLVDTIGLPLDMVVDYLDQKGFMLDWGDFYKEALAAGWKPERTLLRLEEAVGDVYGPQHKQAWRERMGLLIGM